MSGNHHPRGGIGSKFKQLFSNKNEQPPPHVDDTALSQRRVKPLSSAEKKWLDSLSDISDQDSRLRALDDISNKLLDGRPLPEGVIETVLDSIRDLVWCKLPRVRVKSLNLLKRMAQMYVNELDALSTPTIFSYIGKDYPGDEIGERLEVLDPLSSKAGEIGYFVTEFAPLLVSWLRKLCPDDDYRTQVPVDSMPNSTSTSRNSSASKIEHDTSGEEQVRLYLLTFLAEAIKVKAAYFSSDEIRVIIERVCHQACRSTNVREIYAYLDLLKVILEFDILDVGDRVTLTNIVFMLCFLSEKPDIVTRLWQLVDMVLRTPLHSSSAIEIMCHFCEEDNPNHRSIKGAVAFMGLALWGTKRIPDLRLSPCAVLPSMQRAVAQPVVDSGTANEKTGDGSGAANQKAVDPGTASRKTGSITANQKAGIAHEVLQHVKRLVQKYPDSLQMTECDSIVNILRETWAFIQSCQADEGGPTKQKVTMEFHKIIDEIETYHEKNHHFNGAEEQFFHLLEVNAADRSEKSINFLLDYKCKRIGPEKEQWIGSLKKLMCDHFINEARTSIRIKAIHIFKRLYAENMFHYGDRLIDQVLRYCCDSMTNEKDYEVLGCFADTLIDICKETSRQDQFEDLVRFVQNLMNRYLEDGLRFVEPSGPSTPSNRPEDAARRYWSSESAAEHFAFLAKVVTGLIEVMARLWFSSQAAHAIVIHDALVRHLVLQYRCGLGSHSGSRGSETRGMILQHVAGLRCNTDGLVGRLRGQNEADFSKFMVHSYPDDVTRMSPPQSPSVRNVSLEPSPFDFTQGFAVLITALQKENCYRHWKALVEKLPRLLIYAKAMICGVGAEHINSLASSLIAATNDSYRPKLLYDLSFQPTVSDLRDLLYPSLAPLVAYKGFLDPQVQIRLVKAIQDGLQSREPLRAVLAITSCVIEMGLAIQPMMKELLTRLAGIKPTAKVAIAIIELMGVIVRYLTQRQPKFTEKDFTSVFDTLLNYLNPFQFTHFIVAQAYHVTCIWFACTPLSLRHVVAQRMLKTMQAIQQQAENSNDADLKQIAEMHTNVTFDLLSLYTFCDNPIKTVDKNIKEFLFTKNQSVTKKSWAYGDRLITITTTDSAAGGGLCASCTRMYAPFDPLSQQLSPFSPAEDVTKILTDAHEMSSPRKISFEQGGDSLASSYDRKRHRSEGIVRNPARVREARAMQVRAYDDSSLNRAGPEPNTELNSYEAPETPILSVVRFGIPSTTPEQSEKESALEPGELADGCQCWTKGWALVEVRHAWGKSEWMLEMPQDESLFIDRYPFAPELISAYSSTLTVDQPAKVARPGSVRNLGVALSIPTDMPLTVNFDHQKVSSRMSVPLAGTGPGPLMNQISSTSLSSYHTARSESNAPGQSRDREPSVLDNPSTLFLQLFLDTSFQKLISKGASQPLLLEPQNQVDNSLRHMDTVAAPRIGRSIGVIYIGPGQKHEKEILSNRHGSARYERFIRGLGELVYLADYGSFAGDCHEYSGGLDTVSGTDGQFAPVYQDTLSRIVFHVVTLMTSGRKDPINPNEVKRHIGNDFVVIVYNESNEPYRLDLIKSQFGYAAIEVQPVDDHLLAVHLQAKDEISRWLSLKEILVSDEAAPNLCRQMALRAELSSQIWFDTSRKEPEYLSRPVERLREIRRIRAKYDTGSKDVSLFAPFM